MTPQDLKNSILQRAIEGNLVEQRAEEGTGEELYQQIQAKKQRLINEGKIKREKALPEITDDEKPFDIPDSWKWVRWGNIVNVVSARRVHQSDWKTTGIPFYRAREIARLADFGYVNNELYISQELFEEYSRSGVPAEGDLMVTAVGTLGKTYIVKKNDHFYYKDASVICLENFGRVSSKYLKYLMESEMMAKQIKSNSSGTTVGTLTIVRMNMYCLPLPPLAEQKRIVAKIEELMPMIDEYAAAWNRLEDFNTRFPDDMKKSILQRAIEGKLVEQRPEEGTGEELYQQIQAEKQKLIREGKIKKEKALPDITDDEKPFDIPDSWKWCYCGDVFQHNTGKALNSSNGKGTLYHYITTSNLYWDHFELDGLKQMYFTDDELQKDTAVKGDLLVCEGGDFGRAAIWNGDPICIQNHLHRLRPYAPVDIKYFYYIFFLYKNSGKISGKGIGIQGLSSGALHKLIMPLPPLAEQKRIVAKIEELLPLCDQLKQKES